MRYGKRKEATPPPPCVVTKFVAGVPVATETVVRAPIRSTCRQEGDVVVRRFRVMAEQETGEEHFVAYASTLAECDLLIAAHGASHPEHRSCWFERL